MSLQARNNLLEVVLGVVLLGFSFGPCAAGQPPSFPRRVKARALPGNAAPKGHRTILLTLEIEKGWFIFANPVENKDLRIAQTRVTVTTPGAKLTRIDYPRGAKVADPFIGDYRIYKGKVEIVLTVQVKQATVPIELLLKCHPMTEEKGSLPEQLKLKVP